ncbi:NEDD4-binding protein 2-like, partial [Limulus polyphemus]|uniref:NEDD4-binding protein 2-like n=1 Tax=Limulus polyphemus TaxID=6850 RepID=A0ABM1BRK0_LIMPO
MPKKKKGRPYGKNINTKILSSSSKYNNNIQNFSLGSYNNIHDGQPVRYLPRMVGNGSDSSYVGLEVRNENTEVIQDGSSVMQREFSVRDDVDPHASLKYLQEMFHEKLDADVVHMVLSECEFNVEQALETLFTLISNGGCHDDEGNLHTNSSHRFSGSWCVDSSDGRIGFSGAMSLGSPGSSGEQDSSFNEGPVVSTSDVEVHHSADDNTEDEARALSDDSSNSVDNCYGSDKEKKSAEIKYALDEEIIRSDNEKLSFSGKYLENKSSDSDKSTGNSNLNISYTSDSCPNSNNYFGSIFQGGSLFTLIQQPQFITPIVSSTLPLAYKSREDTPDSTSSGSLSGELKASSAYNRTRSKASNLFLSCRRDKVNISEPGKRATDVETVLNRIKNGEKILVILRGLPGSGKSTLSQQLKANGVVYSTDDFFIKRDKYQFDWTKLHEAHEWNRKRTTKALEKGKSPIIIDNTNIELWEIKPYVVLGVKFGYNVELVEPDTVWKFNAAQCAKRNTHGVSKEKILRMFERYDSTITVDSILSTLKKNVDLSSSGVSMTTDYSSKAATELPKDKTVSVTNEKPSCHIPSTPNDQDIFLSNKQQNDNSIKKNDPITETPNLKGTQISRFPKNAGFSLADGRNGISQLKLKWEELMELAQQDSGSVSRRTSASLSSQDTSSWEKDEDFFWTANGSPAHRGSLILQRETVKEESEVDTDSDFKHSSPICVSHSFSSRQPSYSRSQETIHFQFKEENNSCYSDNHKIENKCEKLQPKSQRQNNKKKYMYEPIRISEVQNSVEMNEKLSSEKCFEWNADWECKRECLHWSSSESEIQEEKTKLSPRPQRKARHARKDPALSYRANELSSESDTDRSQNLKIAHVRHTDELNHSEQKLSDCSSFSAKCKNNWSLPAFPVDFKKKESEDQYSEVFDPPKSGNVSKNDNETQSESKDFIILQKVQKNHVIDSEIIVRIGSIYYDKISETGKSVLLAEKDAEIPIIVKLHKSTTTHDLPDTMTKSEKLEFLKNCFPDIGEEDIVEIFEKCQGDHHWTVNILLDFGYEYNNHERISDLAPLQIIEECDHPQKNQGDNDMLTSGNKILDGLVCLPEPTQELSANTKHKGQGYNPSSQNIMRDASVQINQDQSSSVSNTLEMVLDVTFALQLEEIFGPIQLHTSAETLSSDDLRVVLDEKILRLIYDQWIKRLQEKYPKEEIEPFKDVQQIKSIQIEADKTYLEERKQRLGKDHIPLSEQKQEKDCIPLREQRLEKDCIPLREIMDMEMALHLSREEKLKDPASKGHELASHLKRRQLYELFPGVDESALDEVLESTNYSLLSAVAAVEGATGQSSCQSEFIVKELTSGDEDLDFNMDFLEWVSLEATHDSVNNAATVLDFKDLRAEANLHQHLRNECFQKAREAYRRGMKAVASFYSQQGHLHTQKLKDANQRAAEKLLEQSNKDMADFVLDLHGLYQQEALEALENFLTCKMEELRVSPDRKMVVYVITGRGSHSVNKKAKIKLSVFEYLERHNF